ncbi:MAG: hypothetical protein QM638_05860 [Nocardioides sp.]|uniref:hypothetical protein n=1 Tax=Nocardioides sp. TaxID=35761 RepID=UPI0039E21DD8
MRDFPLPTGSTRIVRPRGAPRGYFDATRAGLVRQRWWSVPLRRAALERWLRRNRPDGLRVEGGIPSGQTTSSSGTLLEAWYDGRDTTAYAAPQLHLGYVARGDHTLVWLDDFVDPRRARHRVVPVSSDRVTIRRVSIPADSPRRRRVATATITEPATVRRLVRRFDALPGATVVAVVRGCPMMRVSQTYRLRFTGPDGVYTVTGGSGCDPSLTLRRHGSVVGPRIDAGSRFFSRVDRLLA